MRLFAAIYLPASVRQELLARTRALHVPDIRWLSEPSLHVTLQFFGYVEELKLAPLKSAIEQAAAVAPFTLRCEGFGIFPNEKRPRVFWTGLGGDVERLKSVADDLRARATVIGFPTEERAFVPHLTLGRANERHGRAALEGAAAFKAAFETFSGSSFRVEELHLVRSHLHAQGVRYETLQSFPLRGTDRQ